MANIRNSNTAFIDTAASLPDIENAGIRITSILVTPIGGGTAKLVLDDKTTGARKVDIRVPAGNPSRHIPYSADPISFPNGIVPVTVDFCVATLSLQEARR